jgi:hypothetical protein
VILWRFFGNSLSHRSAVAAGNCAHGDLTVAVVADPSIADHVQGFADRFNKTAKPVGDRCVSVQVKPVDSDAVVSGFIGDWPAQLGQRPALWIPGSSISAARIVAMPSPPVQLAATAARLVAIGLPARVGPARQGPGRTERPGTVPGFFLAAAATPHVLGRVRVIARIAADRLVVEGVLIVVDVVVVVRIAEAERIGRSGVPVRVERLVIEIVGAGETVPTHGGCVLSAWSALRPRSIPLESA